MKTSGRGMDKDMAEHFSGYVKKGRSGWDIDTKVIDARIKEYSEQAAAAVRYSISGLCIALGITRNTLELWRSGYVCGSDSLDKRVKPNGELMECIAKGELFIHRYWEESEKSTTLHTKFLESAGLLGQKQTGGRRPPFDLGRLKKYCK